MTEPATDNTAVLRSRSGAGIKLFLETKTKSYEIPAATSGALLTAVKKMLDVEPDAENVDVLAIDTDDLFERFRIKNAGLTDQSFAAYKSRFKRATTMYQRWLDGENWRPTSSKTGNKKSAMNGKFVSGGSKNASSNPRSNVADETSWSAPPDPPPPAGGVDPGRDAAGSGVDLFPYRVFLVDSNVTITLQLPPTYSARDAAKITGLINALATPDASASDA